MGQIVLHTIGMSECLNTKLENTVKIGNDRNELIYKTETDSQTENEFMVNSGAGVKEG